MATQKEKVRKYPKISAGCRQNILFFSLSGLLISVLRVPEEKLAVHNFWGWALFGHPSSISLSNVSFCVPILGSKNVTCLSDGPALHGFQIRSLTYSFLRGLAAPVIWKVRVLCYEFTDVTLAWEDGQWVEAHKIILAGCSPKKSTPTLMFELNGSYSYVQETKTATANRSRFWLPKIRT